MPVKLNVATIVHLLGNILVFLIAIATIVAANKTDEKLAASAIAILPILNFAKRFLDEQDNAIAVKASVVAVAPAIQAATVGNEAQENAVKNTLSSIPK